LEEQLPASVEIDIRKTSPGEADYGLMEQVLYNLVYNAALYTPEKTLIRISANPAAKPGACGGRRWPRFPETEIAKVFDKFYRSPIPQMRVPGSGGRTGIIYCKKVFWKRTRNGRINEQTVPAGPVCHQPACRKFSKELSPNPANQNEWGYTLLKLWNTGHR